MAGRRPNLRAVADGEKPPPRSRTRKPTVAAAAKSGNLRELLVATRDRLAVAVDKADTPARELAALTKRLLDTVREIEAIDQREREQDGDEVGDGEFDASAI